MKTPMKLALAALLSLAPLTAHADIIPPDVERCSGKSLGDACGDNGRCAESSCSRATPDGMVSYSCVKCVEAAPEPEPAPAAVPASEKKNCSSAPEGMALGLLAVVGFAARARRRRA